MIKELKDFRSKCCNAEINVRETGVSQLSYGEEYNCEKCDKKLNVERVFKDRSRFFKEINELLKDNK